MAAGFTRTARGNRLRDRALAKVGKSNVPGMCAKETRLLAGLPPVGDFDRDGDADAVDLIRMGRARGLLVEETNPERIPGGSIVLWSGGSNGFGHAAPAYATGRVVSTDWGGRGRWAKARVRDVGSRWGMTLVGFLRTGWDGEALVTPNRQRPQAPASSGVDRISVAVVRGRALDHTKGRARKFSDDVRDVQALLNLLDRQQPDREGKLKLDGLWDAKTTAAYRSFERVKGFDQDDGIPDANGRGLRALVAHVGSSREVVA